MTARNLRHFRVFLAVSDTRSVGQAAARCGVSQPAVTQALAKLERESGGALFERTRQGFFPTARGEVFAPRIRRAMERLDTALAEVSPRLTLTATAPQLQALVAVAEAQNFTLAARNLGLAQPTVHRAVTQLEQEAARALFERTSFGVVPTRACVALVRATRLAFSEVGQAEADLAEFDGREAGSVVIGALPLSRTVILPEALARFREQRPKQRVTVIDGPYDEMLGGLRRGEIDVIVGALRDPAPVSDIVQEPLFTDRLAVLARPGHPLAGSGTVPLETLMRFAWAVPRPGTPSRAQFDALFESRGLALPDSIVECGSILLMRELLARSDLLGCISGHQSAAEVGNGLVVRLQTEADWPGRAIGMTTRAGWIPTAAQGLMLDTIRAIASRLGPV
ncbi:LysR family transcriptional regulator [Roseibacterium sp. SDUM158016]|uniref:LysR family transcriptional regulator n=1 Tax=Roseicyclus sediminis TaxID=2980997 RepID=UPI0021D00CC9|nr:LysR family transcriptional regulator [Roseibacterium sp. SDUM158016]MCU4653716.1 LysR family transcriptional regulator [Roseibacterium sp. SDUM158016]